MYPNQSVNLQEWQDGNGQLWLKAQASTFASFVKSVLDVCMTPGASNPDAPACDRLAIDLVRGILPSLNEPVTPLSLARVVAQADTALSRFAYNHSSPTAQKIDRLWRECVLAQLYRDVGLDRFVEFLTSRGGNAAAIAAQPSGEEVGEVTFARVGKDFSSSVVIRVGTTTLRMNEYTLARLLEVALAFNNVRPKSCGVDLPSSIKVTFGPETV